MSAPLDIDQLQTFVAIADTGSFTKAADRVFKTQSAVSMQMRRLEERIGKPLFMKDGRGNRLTVEGDRLLNFARRMIRLNNEAMASFDDNRLEGTLRIGTPDDYADRYMPEIIVRFRQDASERRALHHLRAFGGSCGEDGQGRSRHRTGYAQSTCPSLGRGAHRAALLGKFDQPSAAGKCANPACGRPTRLPVAAGGLRRARCDRQGIPDPVHQLVLDRGRGRRACRHGGFGPAGIGAASGHEGADAWRTASRRWRRCRSAS